MSGTISSSSVRSASAVIGRGAPRDLASLTPAQMPFVTLCTPTFNRRPFLAAAKRCVAAQTYPRERMEWLVLDDGTDPVGDLFTTPAWLRGLSGACPLDCNSPRLEKEDDWFWPMLPEVRYVRLDEKLPLGAKRDRMKDLARGELLVYIDDDDYYPPTRVAHAVAALLAHPEYRIAGAKCVHVYFSSERAVFRYGPYSDNPEFAGAASFAFWRDYPGRFDPRAALAEENAFTRDFSEPMLALDPLQTLLIVAHEQHSYDKRWALRAAGRDGRFGRSDGMGMHKFIRAATDARCWLNVVAGDAAAASRAAREAAAAQMRIVRELARMYLGGRRGDGGGSLGGIHAALAAYPQGSVHHKPDVMRHLRLLGKAPPPPAEQGEEETHSAVNADAAAAAAAATTVAAADAAADAAETAPVTTTAVANATDASSSDERAHEAPAAPAAAAAASTTAAEASTRDVTGGGVQPYLLYATDPEQTKLVRALSRKEVQALFADLEDKCKAVSDERDAFAGQVEQLKQECARLRAAAVAGGAPVPAAAAPPAGENKRRKRRFGIEDYECCIAQLACDALVGGGDDFC